ncbi:hypothetical protein D8L92_09450 [Capnocytophaga canimorsus]|nr:hypothetical protein D8L92_09450 [Capnocytophaga canimorsus]
MHDEKTNFSIIPIVVWIGAGYCSKFGNSCNQFGGAIYC